MAGWMRPPLTDGAMDLLLDALEKLEAGVHPSDLRPAPAKIRNAWLDDYARHHGTLREHAWSGKQGAELQFGRTLDKEKLRALREIRQDK